MRLSSVEKNALMKAVMGLPHEVFLFGSRCDENRRGGDVDVLILARGLSAADQLNLELKVSARFQMICEEKIDVVVLDPDRLTPPQEAFLTLIGAQKIRLAA